MNILFISMGEFQDLSQGSVHIDVLKALSRDHNVYLVCKRERREKKKTEATQEYGIHVLRVRTGNIKRTSLIEKGISTIRLESQFTAACKKYLSEVRFDLILYTTPPVTLVKTIRYIKERDNAFTYLMLKDIWPQSAVDLGALTTTGLKGLVYRYLRNKEKKLYDLSDIIGCMTPKNCSYLLEHNPEISEQKVEVFPNCINVLDHSINDEESREIRRKYDLPDDKKLMVYGGNLGKPQGIPFLIQCIESVQDMKDFYFVIVGTGTEYSYLSDYIKTHKLSNVKLMERLPKDEYDKLVSSADVGMLCLDYRFTTPNFPARLLSYMQARLPVMAITDPCTDVGEIIREGKFGWHMLSSDPSGFRSILSDIQGADLKTMGNNAYKCLSEHYDVNKCCDNMIAGISARQRRV